VIRKALANILLKISTEFSRVIEIADEALDRFGRDPDIIELRAIGTALDAGVLQSYRLSEAALEKRQEIIDALREAHMLDPTNVRRLFRAAMLFFRLEDYENARAAATLGIQLMPESSSFRVILAQVSEYGSSDKSEGLISQSVT
jgi:hypothetical protein